MPYVAYEQSIAYGLLADWRPDNFKHFGIQFPSRNKWGVPDLARYTGNLPPEMVPFNCLNNRKGENVLPHFFLKDHIFDSAWTKPGGTVNRLKEFGITCGPDFSLFTDWPVAVQMFNLYRNCWLSCLWASYGINVVPTVCWSGPDSLEWCFAPFPKRSVVAVSTVGVKKGAETRALFIRGYKKMVKRINPLRVIVHGSLFKELDGLVDTVCYPDKWEALYGRKRG